MFESYQDIRTIMGVPINSLPKILKTKLYLNLKFLIRKEKR